MGDRCVIACILNDEEHKHLLDINKRVYSSNGLAPTLTTVCGGGQEKIVADLHGRIRKLTPLECWRLMGFEDHDYDKAKEVVSKSQLYKQAGNSIVVDVLEAIFKEMI